MILVDGTPVITASGTLDEPTNPGLSEKYLADEAEFLAIEHELDLTISARKNKSLNS